MKPLNLNIIIAIQGINGSLDNITPDYRATMPIYRSLTSLLIIVQSYDTLLPTHIPFYYKRKIRVI